jgi:hypothetical protein
MTGGREVSPGMTGGGEVFVRNDVCVLIRHSFAALGCGQASPSSFLRSDGLWVMAEKESHCISDTSSNKSLRVGLTDLINSSFQALFHFLSLFSLAMASSIVGKNSKYNKSTHLYLLVKLHPIPFLCS